MHRERTERPGVIDRVLSVRGPWCPRRSTWNVFGTPARRRRCRSALRRGAATCTRPFTPYVGIHRVGMDALTQRVSQESGRIADVAVACHQRNRGKASGSAWAAHSALVAAASPDAEFVRRYGVKVKACQAGNAKRKSNIERPFRDLKESFLQGADGGRCPQTRSTNSITLARSPTWFTFAPSPGTGSAARSHQLLGQSVEVRLAVDSVESDCRGPGRRSPGTASPGGIVEGWGLGAPHSGGNRCAGQQPTPPSPRGHCRT